MISDPNQPAAGKAGFTRLFAIERPCPGLPERGSFGGTVSHDLVNCLSACETKLPH